MILVYDGPFIWMFIAMIIVFIAYKKDKKEIKTLQKEVEDSQANIEDFDRAREAIYNGSMILKKDDFKHLKEYDFTYFANNHGVKFV